MRIIAHIVWALGSVTLAGLILILVLANRAPITLSLHPLPFEMTSPLYLVLALAFVTGLSVGFSLYLSYRLRTGLVIRKQRRQLAAAQLLSSGR